MISKINWGKHDEKDVYLFTIENKNGTKAEITNYGGILKSLIFKGVDTVLGRDSLEEYLTNDGCYGALIGRNSNRIENSEFTLNGKAYKLFANNGRNNLHGGKVGFNKKVWDAEELSDNSLVLKLFSPDGEEGFPGNVNVTVTYTLTEQDSLKIQYEAATDADTIVNLTNHSYFNLDGHGSGVIDEQTIEMDCDFFTPNTDECMPFGEIKSVANTPFDLRKPTKFKNVFASDCEQIKMFNGFDHNFCLNGRGFRKFAVMKGAKSGISMEMYTDLPGVQIYTGNSIHADRICKNGEKYLVHQGVAFETQVFPNALKFSHFPSSILKEGEKYFTVTEYKFV